MLKDEGRTAPILCGSEPRVSLTRTRRVDLERGVPNRDKCNVRVSADNFPHHVRVFGEH
jgi:hypothetical protein